MLRSCVAAVVKVNAYRGYMQNLYGARLLRMLMLGRQSAATAGAAFFWRLSVKIHIERRARTDQGCMSAIAGADSFPESSGLE